MTRRHSTGAPIPPDRLSRALTLLSYLLDHRRGETVPLEAIRTDLGLDRAEVEEDLRLLNYVNCGGGTYVIYGEVEGSHVTVERWPEGEELERPARLSPLMAKSLLLALELVGDDLPMAESASLAGARAKVEMLTAGLDLEGDVALGDANPLPSQLLAQINQALRGRLLLTMEYYVASRNEVRPRSVEPYLLWHSGDTWYLEAFCRDAGGQRTFRLDCIRSARATAESFSPREDMDLSGCRKGVFGLEQTITWATLRVPASLGPRLRESGLDVQEMQEGDPRVRIPYLGDRWLVREVLRYGGKAVLEDPKSLRAEVARTARGLMTLYEP
jgi:predicted DNA-binding transcriptional regulator YafY